MATLVGGGPRTSFMAGWESKGFKVPNIDTPHLRMLVMGRREAAGRGSRLPRLPSFGVLFGNLEQVIGRMGIEILGFGRMLGIRFGGGRSLFKERPGGEARPCAILWFLVREVKEDFRAGGAAADHPSIVNLIMYPDPFPA